MYSTCSYCINVSENLYSIWICVVIFIQTRINKVDILFEESYSCLQSSKQNQMPQQEAAI